MLPHTHRRKHQHQNTSCCNSLVLLHIPPGIIDRIPNRRPRLILHLRQITPRVQRLEQVLILRRQRPPQPIRERVGINRRRNRIPYSAPNTIEQTQHRQQDWDPIPVRRTHHRHLLTNDQHTTRESNEDLTHDHIPNICILTAKMNHQPGTQEHQRRREAQARVLEFLDHADPEPEDGGPDARSDGVDGGHVAGFGYVQIVDDHYEVVEVAVPAVKAEVDDCGKEAGAEDGAVPEKVVGDEVDPGAPSLPGCEDKEENETDDYFGDEGGVMVFCSAITS